MMKTRTRVVVMALAVLLIAGVRSTASTGRAATSLRIDQPLEAVVADLETFIPTYMEREGVPGIQHSPEGDALWQWGQAFDFQSVMMIYPELGYGAVVLTNSDALKPDVAIDIAHRALGGSVEAIRDASHLAFNYEGPFLEE